PRVVRALNRLGKVPRRGFTETRAAVTTDVEERAQLTAPVPENDERLAGDGAEHVVPGIDEGARPTCAVPRSREDAGALFQEDVGRRVVLAGHRPRALLISRGGV